MSFFKFLKKDRSKNKYQIFYESISEIISLLERKKRIIDSFPSGSVFIDLEPFEVLKEQKKLIDIIKSGSIAFLGVELSQDILKIFRNDELNKDEIQVVWDYLLNEQDKLRKLF